MNPKWYPGYYLDPQHWPEWMLDAMPHWKVIVYDKVLGLGTTDAIAGDVGAWAGVIITTFSADARSSGAHLQAACPRLRPGGEISMKEMTGPFVLNSARSRTRGARHSDP